ncbi:hypothetical protein CANDROIZ_410001 [Candidatus Roizmanbacteria bacterium]|nr:hypothetical protein CANDROIZ_410001 [Candidatus Roizmanbacteria bacterium]
MGTFNFLRRSANDFWDINESIAFIGIVILNPYNDYNEITPIL